MELSKNITISNGIFEGERRIRLHYRMEPKTKNISFSVNEWILLLALLEEIKRFFSRVLTEDAPTEKTWDLIPEGRGGNKRVTVKRFESGTTIVDFRIFNFHVKPELPTKYGVSLNKSEGSSSWFSPSKLTRIGLTRKTCAQPSKHVEGHGVRKNQIIVSWLYHRPS